MRNSTFPRKRCSLSSLWTLSSRKGRPGTLLQLAWRQSLHQGWQNGQEENQDRSDITKPVTQSGLPPVPLEVLAWVTWADAGNTLKTYGSAPLHSCRPPGPTIPCWGECPREQWYHWPSPAAPAQCRWHTFFCTPGPPCLFADLCSVLEPPKTQTRNCNETNYQEHTD